MEAGRWHELTLPEQLGNIGSEFHRWTAVKSEKSFAETLDLLDLTISDIRWNNRLKELTRLREIICDVSMDSKFYDTSATALEKYLFSFALLARRKK